MNQYDHENEIELDKYLTTPKESKFSMTDKKILNLMKKFQNIFSLKRR